MSTESFKDFVAGLPEADDPFDAFTLAVEGGVLKKVATSNFQGGGGGGWERPAEWLAMPAMTGSDQMFAGLVAVFPGEGNFLAFTCAGNYTVDWGDGSAPENVATGVKAEHIYDYDDLDPGTEFRGYRQAMVTVVPNGGNLTSVNLLQKITTLVTGLSDGGNSNFLDIKMAGSNVTTLVIGTTSNPGAARFNMLEHFEYVGTSGLTSCVNLFTFISKLSRIDGVDWTASVTDMNGMFSTCQGLTVVPQLNTASLLNATNMFSGCDSLTTVPQFNTSSVTNMSGMFSGCDSLTTVPQFNTSSVTNMNSLFSGCPSLTECPALNASSVTTMTSPFGSATASTQCSSLRRSQLFGAKLTHLYQGARLGVAAINEVFENLGIPASSQTLTTTGNYGAAVNVSKASSGTTSGSAVVTISNTSSIVVGQFVTGTGISTGRAVTFTDAGDTVNRTAHGFVNGQRVSFETITTTTGITAWTPYYVINANANNFQLSLTAGGSAIPLTNNGSGSMLYDGCKVLSIVPNTSVTLSVPASATGSVTLAFREINTAIATMKRWTVTG